MDVIRDLIRDLVGIIFPGGLLIGFTLWLLSSVIIIFVPVSPQNLLSIGDSSVSFFTLLIFSYVAGQFLRLKRVDALENLCTKAYRKKYKPTLTDENFNEAIEKINQVEAKYHAGEASLDELKDLYSQFNKEFGFWEEFPYLYSTKAMRFLEQPATHYQFFKDYDEQGIGTHKAFLNFCKTVIYQYSPSLKEEVLRQEALVRLMVGIYYVIKYGKFIALTTGFLHLAMIISFYWYPLSFISYVNLEYSYQIVIVSFFAYFILTYLNKELVEQLRYMRVKEVIQVYESFYVVSKENNLSL